MAPLPSDIEDASAKRGHRLTEIRVEQTTTIASSETTWSHTAPHGKVPFRFKKPTPRPGLPSLRGYRPGVPDGLLCLHERLLTVAKEKDDGDR